MATDIPINNICRYVIEGLQDDQMTQNVFYLMTNGATTLEAAEDFLNNNLFANFAQFLSNEWTGVRVSIQGISPTHTDPYEEAKAYPGQQNVLALPVGNAAIVAMKTGVGGRHNRGRKYLPAIPRDYVENSKLTDAYRADLQTRWDLMNNIFKLGGTGELHWGIWSKLSAGPPPEFQFRAVNSVIVRPILGTMRSRLPGHGR